MERTPHTSLAALCKKLFREATVASCFSDLPAALAAHQVHTPLAKPHCRVLESAGAARASSSLVLRSCGVSARLVEDATAAIVPQRGACPQSSRPRWRRSGQWWRLTSRSVMQVAGRTNACTVFVQTCERAFSLNVRIALSHPSSDGGALPDQVVVEDCPLKGRRALEFGCGALRRF